MAELDEIKQKLREAQETIHQDSKQPYVEIEIPENGKVGDWCTVKFNKKVPYAQISISEKLEWKRRDKFDYNSKPELVSTPFIVDYAQNVDSIKVKWEDIGYVATQPTNLLHDGEYLVEVRAFSKQVFEETTARRLVAVSK